MEQDNSQKAEADTKAHALPPEVTEGLAHTVRLMDKMQSEHAILAIKYDLEEVVVLEVSIKDRAHPRIGRKIH